MRQYFYIILLSGFFLPVISFAQMTIDSASFISSSLEISRKIYDQNIKYQSGIYNGKEYVDYDQHINGHQFFDDEFYAIGRVSYFGQIYDSASIKYDIHLDQLVLEYYDFRGLGRDLSLNMDRVDWFDVHGHHFIKIINNRATEGLKPGFYDALLQSGGLKIIASRRKDISEDISGQRITRDFIMHDKYYVIIADMVYKVQNRNSVLKAFSSHKNELKKYIKENHFDFNNNFEYSLIQLTNYYLNTYMNEN